MNEQTGILKILLEAWTKKEAHNKAEEAELDELQAVTRTSWIGPSREWRKCDVLLSIC
jgi:hypothetical protein